jgi:hypothetical protein
MLIWIMTLLVAGGSVCLFVDAVKPQAWTARGLFLVALALFVDLLNQAMS